jgi:hypothetical protein
MSGLVGDNLARASGVIKAAGGGKILQIVNTVKTDTSQLSTSFADISGLSVAITPSSTESKIYIAGAIMFGGGHTLKLKMLRDIGGAGYANSAYIGDTAGSRIPCIAFTSHIEYYGCVSAGIGYLDTTNTESEVTYKFQGKTDNSTYFFGVNCGYADSNNSTYARGASSVTAFEIGE